MSKGMRLLRCSYMSGAWQQLPDSSYDGPSTLVLLFGASELDVRAPIAELRRVLPEAVLIGCSSAGEIHQAQVADNSIGAAVVQFQHTRLQHLCLPIDQASSREAGSQIARTLAAPDLRVVIAFSEGVSVNGSELARGLADVGPQVVVAGGLAGDGERFGATWVVCDDVPTSGRVCAVGLYGTSLQVGHGSRGGWDIFGPERSVTRSSGNVLYELDGKPALALYKTYLGERAAGLPTAALLFPLAILAGDRRVVRTVLAVDEDGQSMRFAGDIPEGSRVQLMRGNFDRLILGAQGAATAARGPGSDPVLALAVSCVGRRLLMKSRIDEELEATLDALPPETQQIGFYSYGELASAHLGACELHNQTMTLTTFSEAA